MTPERFKEYIRCHKGQTFNFPTESKDRKIVTKFSNITKVFLNEDELNAGYDYKTRGNTLILEFDLYANDQIDVLGDE